MLLVRMSTTCNDRQQSIYWILRKPAEGAKVPEQAQLGDFAETAEATGCQPVDLLHAAERP